MTKTAIHVDHIARVEGQGNVHVVIEDGAVKTVEMNVVEPARLFESMVRGRSWREVSYISSRICGICSASHVVTDLKAIERIFGVQVTPRTCSCWQRPTSWGRRACSRWPRATRRCSRGRSA